MATLFVDSNVGAPVSPYDTWAKAAGDLQTALADAACVAGSLVKVAYDHSKAYGIATILAVAGTVQAPITIVSCDPDDNDAYRRGATEYTSASVDLSINWTVNIFGMDLKSGDDLDLQGANNRQSLFYDCLFELTGTNGGDALILTGDGQKYEFHDCNVDFANVDQSIYVSGQGNYFFWYGGTLLYNIKRLLEQCSNGGTAHMHGVDLSIMDNSGADRYILGSASSTSDEPTEILITGCKFNSSPPSIAFNNPITAYDRRKIVGCHSGNTPYFYEQTSYGDIEHESTIYRQGADPAGNNFSAEMVCSFYSDYYNPMRYKLADIWCSANPILTIELAHYNAGGGKLGKLQNNEFWVEVEHPTNANAAYRQWDRSSKPDPFEAGQNLLRSDETWQGGLPDKQFVNVEISGGAEGIHSVWVCFATGATDTVYVCPQIDVTYAAAPTGVPTTAPPTTIAPTTGPPSTAPPTTV